MSGPVGLEPRFSDDRQWYWNGSAWIPALQAPIPPPAPGAPPPPPIAPSYAARGGATEHAGDMVWMARGLASHLLYHERWCSDLPLQQHPRQDAVRGAAAAEYLADVDRSLAATGRDVLLQA